MRSRIVMHVVNNDPAANGAISEKLRCAYDVTVTRFESTDELEKSLPGALPDVIVIGAPAASAAAIAGIRAAARAVPLMVAGRGFSEEQALAWIDAGATDVVDEASARSLAVAVAGCRGRGGGAYAASAAAVLQALPLGVYVLNEDETITPLNAAARTYAPGTKPSGTWHLHDFKAWWHDTGKRIRSEDWSGCRALREGLETVGEVIDIECADGVRRTMCHSAVPLRDIHGHVIAAVLAQEDVTERKRLEEQVQQAHKMDSVGLLAGGVAHDFNNLLTAINGYSQIIEENISEGDELLATSIEQVLAAGRRASELTQKLLAFSRRQPLTLTVQKLDDVIANASTCLSRTVGTDINLTTALAAAGARVLVDSVQFDQVLGSLVKNACDAIGDNPGTIRITTAEEMLSDAEARTLCLDRERTYAVISVSDSGKGIDEKIVKRIFEPFFTTKERARGSGLGLAISYGIVRQHNGALAVASTSVKGSTFKIYLPIARSKGRRAAVPQQVIPFGGAEKILLAEDDHIVREYLSTILCQSGYSVVTAADGAEAEIRFREHVDNISLVITDVVMPEKNGREIHEEIKKMRPDTKVIYISGYTADIINRKGIVDRDIDFLMKPVSRCDFLQKVREVLDRP